ncbi:condensation domain-containing protein [Streptomyces sp. NPDC026665]|uniref:condensation domain-containing protein n=1 Tax=Streptomyces sp. NPDC026665 TaxID=3154798 RepID=UPI0033D6E0D1
MEGINTGTAFSNADQSGATAESTVVRPLGATERMWFRFGQLHPQHFMLAAEFDTALTQDAVRTALAAVQQRHPLLQVGIDDSGAPGPVFRRPAQPPAIALRSVRLETSDWTAVAADEYMVRFDPASAPLMRAVLAHSSDRSVLLLAFDHVICDGVSAVRILDELVAALNGRTLHALPVPSPHEELVAQALDPVDPSVLANLPEPEERMRPWPQYLPFASVRPVINTMTFDEATTAELVHACRAQGTTVQSLFMAAFSQARGTLRNENYVRVLTPIDTRTLLSAADASASVSITVARTGHDIASANDVWTRAKEANAQLQVTRSAPAVAVGALAVGHFIAPDVSAANVEQFMNSQLAYEMQVSNLRVVELSDSGALRPTAVWGPMLLLQIDGETNAGVTTYDGKLRLVVSGYSPNDDLLEEVRRIITEASEGTRPQS